MKIQVDCKNCKEPHFDHFECDFCNSHLHEIHTCADCTNQQQKFCPFCGEPLSRKIFTNSYQAGIISEKNRILFIIQNKIDVMKEYGLDYQVLEILKRDILSR